MAVQGKTSGEEAPLPQKSTKCTGCGADVVGGLKEYRQHVATCAKAKGERR